MEQLIVVFTNKRHLGLTVIPYFASFHENQPISLHEHATPQHITDQPKRFSIQEEAVILLLAKISEQNLFRKYGREGTLKEFMSKLQAHPQLEKEILPFIDKIIYQAICLLAGGKLKAYYKDDTFSNLYDSDRLFIHNKAAQPLFDFELKDKELRYSLKIEQELDGDRPPKIFSLLGRPVEFLCTHTAVLKIHNRIYFLENIDSNKFKPFINKGVIIVPERQVPAYMEGFVSKCVRNFNIVARGFSILYIDEEPLPHLALLKNLHNQPVLALHFAYRNKTFLADRKAPVYVDCVNEKGTYIFHKIRRDFGNEEAVKQQLKELGLKQNTDALFLPVDCPPNSSESATLAHIASWISAQRAALKKLKVSVDTAFDNREIFVGQPRLQLDSTECNDWFEIRARVIIGEFSIPFIKFRKHLIDENPEYELPNGQLFMIPPEWFTRFSELFDYARVDKQVLRLPRTHFQIMERVQHGIKSIDKQAENIPIVFPEIQIPTGLQASLRPYQLEGFAWLNFLRENNYGGILADDMGLGKTLQTITLLLKIYQNTASQPDAEESPKPAAAQLSLFAPPQPKKFNHSEWAASLIVMPTSLVHNWQSEFEKFAPSLRIYNYTGGKRLKSKDIGKILRHYHVVLTSYGILRNDIDYLSTYPFHYCILDESQYVKNPGSKIYDAVKQIEARHRLTLTGTPIENSLVDLWAQMNLVNKGLLGTLPFFKRHFVQPITRQQSAEKEEKLQKLIQPFLLRRTKEKVARDLPPVMEQVQYCEMSPEQASYYEREKSGIRNSIYQVFEHKDPKQSAIMALQALTKLRQIANHPKMADPDYRGSSGKFDQIVDQLESIVAEGHNVLVFSSFTTDLKLLQIELDSKKLPYALLTGATRERARVIEEFNKNASIFLISLKAGGVGLNLTKADYVFLLNPWWNPAAEAQAINRAHRIGQTKNVFVYRFLSTGTIEEKIALLQQKKAQLADVFVNNNNPLNDLSKEEIMELFA